MSIAGRAKTIFDIGSTTLVTLAAGALLWTLYKAPTGAQNTAHRLRIEAVSGLRIDAHKATKRMGQSSVVMVEFTDFQCPYCATFARETYPSIRRDFVDQKKLTYVSFAFPLERIHPRARKASEAAECAARQGRYWEMHERLFLDPAALQEPDVFARNAVGIGLDEARFESCLATEAAAAVAADVAEGERLKVNSTPTFFLGTIRADGSIELVKRINGSAPIEDFTAAITSVAKKG